MPMCRQFAPQVPPKCVSIDETQKQFYNLMYEPIFPKSAVKFNQPIYPPQCKGVYTWVSSPKTMQNNRKFVKIQQK